MSCEGENLLDQNTCRSRFDQAAAGSWRSRVFDPGRQPGLQGSEVVWPACSRAKFSRPDRRLKNSFELGIRHGGIVAEPPQLSRDAGSVPLHALPQIHERGRQIGFRAQ